MGSTLLGGVASRHLDIRGDQHGYGATPTTGSGYPQEVAAYLLRNGGESGPATPGHQRLWRNFLLKSADHRHFPALVGRLRSLCRPLWLKPQRLRLIKPLV